MPFSALIGWLPWFPDVLNTGQEMQTFLYNVNLIFLCTRLAFFWISDTFRVIMALQALWQVGYPWCQDNQWSISFVLLSLWWHMYGWRCLIKFIIWNSTCLVYLAWTNHNLTKLYIKSTLSWYIQGPGWESEVQVPACHQTQTFIEVQVLRTAKPTIRTPGLVQVQSRFLRFEKHQ